MLFILGILFFVLGLVMLIKFIINSRKPKADAKVLGLLKEAPAGQFIEVPQAFVEYVYQNTKYSGKVVLGSKPAVGDTIKVAVKPSAPGTAVEYYPKKEVLVMIVLAALGIGFMIASAILSDMI